jgi:tetratricopeptide (TPR) repeat protein
VLAVAAAAAASLGHPSDIELRRSFVEAEILLARDLFPEARVIYDALSRTESRALERDIVLERLATSQRADPGAAETFMEVLAIREHRFGAHHPRVADALLGLGSVLLHDGQLDEAKSAFTRALEIREEVFGADSGAAAKARSSLGVAAIKAEDYQTAVEHLERAVETALRDPGVVEFDATTIMSNLGIVYSRLGRQEEARALHRRALETMQRVDPEHPRRVIPMINIAASFRRDGKDEEAIPWLEKAADLLIERGEPARAGDMMAEIGDIHLGLGDPETARVWLRRALGHFDLGAAAIRPDNLNVQNARFLFAESYASQKRPRDALGWYEQALAEALERRPTENHTLFVRIRHGLANALAATGESQKAAEIAGAGLARLESLAPDERESMADIERALRRLAARSQLARTTR